MIGDVVRQGFLSKNKPVFVEHTGGGSSDLVVLVVPPFGPSAYMARIWARHLHASVDGAVATASFDFLGTGESCTGSGMIERRSICRADLISDLVDVLLWCAAKWNHIVVVAVGNSVELVGSHLRSIGSSAPLTLVALQGEACSRTAQRLLRQRVMLDGIQGAKTSTAGALRDAVQRDGFLRAAGQEWPSWMFTPTGAAAAATPGFDVAVCSEGGYDASDRVETVHDGRFWSNPEGVEAQDLGSVHVVVDVLADLQDRLPVSGTSKIDVTAELSKSGCRDDSTTVLSSAGVSALPCTFVEPKSDSRGHVVFFSGRPQDRRGPHDLFVQLAEQLSQVGIASARFDVRGSGLVAGDASRNEEFAKDVVAAVECCRQRTGSNLPLLVLAHCDAALPCAMAATRTTAVDQLVYLNPWIGTPADLGVDREVWLRHRLGGPQALGAALRHPVRAVRALKELLEIKRSRSGDAGIAKPGYDILLAPGARLIFAYGAYDGHAQAFRSGALATPGYHLAAKSGRAEEWQLQTDHSCSLEGSLEALAELLVASITGQQLAAGLP